MAQKIQVLNDAQVKQVFGTFTFQNTGGGRIKIDSAWVAANIVPCTLVKARNGQDVNTSCHRLAKDAFEGAFEAIAGAGLSNLIHTWDGLYVPRHQLWKDSNPLSRHSWGIAVDLNASTNGYGNGISPENRALNEIFNRFGFAWGGDWSPQKHRDAMHWELAVLEKTVVKQSLILAIDRPDDGGQVFSYHRVPGATLGAGGAFQVKKATIADLLGKPALPGQGKIRDVVVELGYQVASTANHLADAVDPRVYVFVEAA